MEKKIIYITAALLVLIPLGMYVAAAVRTESSETGAQIVGALETYEHPKLNFSVDHPKAWTIQSEAKGVYFLSPKLESLDVVQETISVLVEPLPDDVETQEQYTKKALDEIAELSNYTMMESKRVSFAGLRGHTITYQATIQNNLIQFRQAWVIYKGKSYLMTLASPPNTFANFERVFGRVIKSLKIEGA